LPAISHAQLNRCERRGGKRAGRARKLLYRSITIILSYYPLSVCPRSRSRVPLLQTAIVIAHTASKKMEGKGKHISAHMVWHTRVLMVASESCGERASERKIYPGIILSPLPPTPPLPWLFFDSNDLTHPPFNTTFRKFYIGPLGWQSR